jgi:hypothetical protein
MNFSVRDPADNICGPTAHERNFFTKLMQRYISSGLHDVEPRVTHLTRKSIHVRLICSENLMQRGILCLKYPISVSTMKPVAVSRTVCRFVNFENRIVQPVVIIFQGS